MSLFPAFRDQNAAKSKNAVYAPEVPELRSVDEDIQIVGTAAVPAQSSLPSFSFDVRNLSSVSKPAVHVAPQEVLEIFSSEDERTERKPQDREERKRKKKEKRKHKKEKRERAESHKPDVQIIPSPKPLVLPLDVLLTNNPKKIFLGETGLAPEKAYCLDGDPDKNNFAFEETYWKNVPKMARPPRWVLGPHADNSSRKKQNTRYFQDKKVHDSIRNSDGVRIPKPEDIVPFGRNYLPFPEELPELVDLEPALPSVESESFRAKTIKFNEKLRENPYDVGCWLDFLQFQDDFTRNAFKLSAKDVENSRSDHVSLLERKLAIVDRAIQNNPVNIPLKIRRLNYCEEILDKDQLAKEWRDFAFAHPNNPYVWTEYLTFIQSFFRKFTVPMVNKAYQKYVTVHRSIAEGMFQSHSAFPHYDKHLVMVLSNLADFWMRCGYQERAMGYLQSMMEINLNFPTTLKHDIPLKEALVFFEPFWDSGVPRFGMKNAQGWENVMKNKAAIGEKVSGDSDIDIAENNLIKSGLSTMDVWIKLELFRQSRFLLPYSGDDDPVDPERVVLFDDINPYVFRYRSLVPNRNDETTILLLTVNVLSILNCPMLKYFSTRSCGWRTGLSFVLKYPWMNLFGNWSESHIASILPDNCSKVFFQPFYSNWADEDMLITGIFEQAANHFSGVFRSFLSISYIQYTLTKFITASSAQKIPAAKEVRIVCKGLLKRPENRNNLLIWEWYTFAESVLEGSSTSATRILETVLNSVTVDFEKQEDLFGQARIIRVYVYNILGVLSRAKMKDQDKTQRKKALSLLVSFAEGGKLITSEDDNSSNRILKARKSFIQLVERYPLQSATNYPRGLYALGSLSCNLTICYAMFQYLTDGFNNAQSVLSEATTTLRDSVGTASNCDFEDAYEQQLMDWEIITENLLQLALYHQKNSSYSSTEFRDLLLQGLQDFPNNSLLLNVLIQSELAMFISGRLRSYFDQTCANTTTVLPWIFAIYAEYERKYRLWKNLNTACESNLVDSVTLKTFRDTGISHRIRSIFQRAVESESGRHSSLIWRMYLKFEMDEENLSRVEGLYNVGIQNCPSDKALYMDVAKYFPQKISEIVDIMTEKELRVMVPYDEAQLLASSKEEFATVEEIIQ